MNQLKESALSLTAKYLFFISFLVFAISCSDTDKAPDYVIEQDKFIDILTDFQKAEALIRIGYHRFQDSVIPNDSVYHAVFRKYNISKVDFDTNYTYYSNQPKLFEKMYDEVIVNLSETSAELAKNKKELPINVED